MNPALELARLLNKRLTTQTVTVVEPGTTTIRATGKNGVMTLKNDGSLYSPGDFLVVRDSVILGRASKEADVPVYYL